MRIALALLLVLLVLGAAVGAGIFLLTRLSQRSSSDRPDI